MSALFPLRNYCFLEVATEGLCFGRHRTLVGDFTKPFRCCRHYGARDFHEGDEPASYLCIVEDMSN